ncbi:hypothetical protein J7337_003278 [Fusarium musae]|uniref:Uncharacterized protein n=1 Tax=Fusarium musae TaxID=1042133 RepID=A0A9P8DRG5_9HYPO|nr:hypothetical protein J7337_003278 [Fusarium musae]KAG9506296.1 hypothetical protein J7337_003278 [Fusarium musae]
MGALISTTILKDGMSGPQYADIFLKNISPYDYAQSDGITNIDIFFLPPRIVGSQNGFISAAAEVFDTNRALVIRVDDIWLAILALLKPDIYKALDREVDMEIPKFTREQLNDWPLVVRCLCEMAKSRFGPEDYDLLMPKFSTTTETHSGAAALILLGSDCPAQAHRKLEKRLHPDYRGAMAVNGARTDLEKMRNSILRLSTRFPKLEHTLFRLDNFVDRLLRAGFQKEFWDQMLETDEQGRVTGGWLSVFFDRRKATVSTQAKLYFGTLTSAVATIPLEVDFGEGTWYCTMVGGLFAHTRDEPGVGNYESIAVEPLPGWLVYLDKDPEGSKSNEATTVEVKGHYD